MGKNTENEMARIQRGLENFLEQELEEAKQERQSAEPKLFIIEEPRQQEKEIHVIGSPHSSPGSSPNRKKSGPKVETYYLEDWDDKSAVQTRRTNSGSRPGGEGNGKKYQERSGRASKGDRTRMEGSKGGSREKSKGARGSDSQNRTGSGQSKGGQSKGRQSQKKAVDGRREGDGAGMGRKKKRSFFSRLKRILMVALLAAALLGLGLYQLVGMVYNKMNYSEIPSQTKLPLQEDGVVNILLIGNDSRQNGEDGRSDAMILLSISRRTRTIYMTSLLRDIYVEIPGHDNNRLNAAYSFGGAELLMETIEQNFDIPVNRYIQVNFEAFANLLDAVGGVDLELSKEEIEYVNGYLVEYNMLTDRPQGTDNMDPEASGMVHLNGPQALAYCRNRYLGTDFGRTERQRKVMTEVIGKLPKAVITNFKELTDGLLPNLTTNLTQFECFRLSLMAGRLVIYDLVSDSIPQPGTYKSSTIRKMSVLEVDFEANRNYLKEKIYGER